MGRPQPKTQAQACATGKEAKYINEPTEGGHRASQDAKTNPLADLKLPNEAKKTAEMLGFQKSSRVRNWPAEETNEPIHLLRWKNKATSKTAASSGLRTGSILAATLHHRQENGTS